MSGLPGGFTELAYIESSGTQYIDTGYCVQDSSSFELEAVLLSGSGAWAAPFGTCGSVGSGECIFYSRNGSGDTVVACWGTNNGAELGSIGAYLNTPVYLSLSKSRASIARKDYAAKASWSLNQDGAPTSSYPLWLFNRNTGGSSMGNFCRMRLMRFRIWDGRSVPARDYVPCRRNSDGVPGLYELATHAFLTNAGSGEFLTGALRDFDKRLFLSGVAVGRQLKGWGAVGSGGGAGYRDLDLRCWEKAAFSSPISFDSGTNTVVFTAISGYYERLYCPAMVKPNTNYRFGVEFSGTFEEGNSPGKTTYFAVTDRTLSDTYIENQDPAVLAKTRLVSNSPGEYAVTFFSGERGFVYLYFDFAAVRDGTTVTLTFKNVSFREI